MLIDFFLIVKESLDESIKLSQVTYNKKLLIQF